MDRVPRWSPDNTWITFFSNRAGFYQLWRVHPDGSELQQMTRIGGIYAAWSPEGARLATNEWIGRPGDVGRAYIFDLRRGIDQEPSFLPPLPSGMTGFTVNSWSGDGTQLAGQNTLAATGLVTYSLRTRSYTQLTDFGEFPVWLPDSRRVLFAADRGRTFRVIDTATREMRTVFTASRQVLGPPRLARDGRTAYFSRRATEADIGVATLDPR